MFPVYRWELAEREDLKKIHKLLDNWRLTGNIYRMEQVKINYSLSWKTFHLKQCFGP